MEASYEGKIFFFSFFSSFSFSIFSTFFLFFFHFLLHHEATEILHILADIMQWNHQQLIDGLSVVITVVDATKAHIKKHQVTGKIFLENSEIFNGNTRVTKTQKESLSQIRNKIILVHGKIHHWVVVLLNLSFEKRFQKGKTQNQLKTNSTTTQLTSYSTRSQIKLSFLSNN